jgi:hypothetical protein
MTTGPKKPKTGTFTISSSIFVNADCVCKNKLYEYDDDWIWYEVLTLKARETSILVFNTSLDMSTNGKQLVLSP